MSKKYPSPKPILKGGTHQSHNPGEHIIALVRYLAQCAATEDYEAALKRDPSHPREGDVYD